MNSITLLSPAKVNLTLKVLGSRPDGYHEISTIMQPVDLFDEIRIEAAEPEGIEVTSSGIEIPTGEDNLAWKAADAFLRESGINTGVKIFIRKNIPTGAGLGGGSSNAAAVLTGLNKIYNVLSEKKLLGIASGLGADVPFFIRSFTALAEGIGEKITVLRDFPLFYYVLLCPPLHVSTGDVYRKWDEIHETDTEESSSVESETTDEIERFKHEKGGLPLRNDLEIPAMELYPEIKSFKQILSSLDAKDILMTGSGSAVFAAFRDEDDAADIYEYLKTSPTFRVFFAKGIKGWHRII